MTTLYKFFKFNIDNLKALESSQVYLSHPSQFNDLLDSRLRLSCDDDDDESMLRYISDYLIKNEDSKNTDNFFYIENLRSQWGTLFKEDDSGEIICDPKPPIFSESFYQSLKFISNISHYIKYLEEKASEKKS